MKHKLATTLVVVTALVLSTFAGLSVVTARPRRRPRPWNLDACGPTMTSARPAVLTDNVDPQVERGAARDDPRATRRRPVRPSPPGPSACSTPPPTTPGRPTTRSPRAPAWSSSRRPAAEHTLANKSKAISFAAYRVLTDLFPAAATRGPVRPHQVDYPAPDGGARLQLHRPAPHAAAARVGNVAAQAVHRLPPQRQLQPARTTRHTPTPPATSRRTPGTSVTDPWRWQPLCVLTAAGVGRRGAAPPPTGGNDCVAPHYAIQSRSPRSGQGQDVRRSRRSQYRVTGPPKNPNGTYSTVDMPDADRRRRQPHDLKKATAEYWADGPDSVFPPGHTCDVRPGPLPQAGPQPGHRRQDVLRARQRDDGRQHRVLVPEVQLRLRAADHRHPLPPLHDKLVNSWLGPNQGFGMVPG